jgi:hypothetical protein
MSERIMNMPTQDDFNAKKLMNWSLSGTRSIFENTKFVPTGEEETTYQGNVALNDTCTWRVPAYTDYLSQLFLEAYPWIRKHTVVRWQTSVHHVKPNDGDLAKIIENGRVVMAMDVLSCIFASLLLAFTVAILAIARPLAVRITLIGISGTLFALLLKLMAGNPTRGEVFGATAAFYAVSVVFVGTTGNGGCR